MPEQHHAQNLNQPPLDMRRSFSYMSGNQYPNNPYAAYIAQQQIAAQQAAAHHAIAHHAAFYPPYYLNLDPSQYNRKRQRRQAAAEVVESLWNKNNMGRKSTAQPRPTLNVPPRGIGPIVEPNENDVLCGRGGRINSHTGNIKFRDVITSKKKDYLAPSTKKLEKAHIAASIVNDIRGMEPSGRFLKEDRDTGLWFDIGDAKAIKKTGQALREDAPDIRHELEGDSSGDDKPASGDKAKKEASEDTKEKTEAKPKAAPKSPKSPKEKATPKKTQSRPQGMVSGRGPQHAQGSWQSNNSGGRLTPQEYQAQVAMPPPYSHQANPYLGQQQQQTQPQMVQNFESRTIPIQAPVPPAIYSLPNQLVSGAKSVGQRMVSASRQAMDVLSQSGGHGGAPRTGNEPVEDIAFGRQFHPPTSAVMSSDNTMSTISGISDNISSTLGGSGLSGFSAGMLLDSNMSNRTPSHMRPSLRMSQLGLGASGMGPSSRSQFAEAMRTSKISDMSGSVRTAGSLNRSFSFPDMSSIADHESWRAIMETDEDGMIQESMGQSLLSGEMSGRFSTGSGRAPGFRDSSAMSVASMSTASSSRWLAGLKDSTMVDDGRSILSEMSSDLHALDLAQMPDATRS